MRFLDEDGNNNVVVFKDMMKAFVDNSEFYQSVQAAVAQDARE